MHSYLHTPIYHCFLLHICFAQACTAPQHMVTWRLLSPSKWQMLHLWCQALVSEVNWFICPQLSNNHEVLVLMGGMEGGCKGCWGRLGFEWSDHSQMCGRWYCRRCGSFGQPILNHQGSQHSDILENHIYARRDAHDNTHTQTHTLYTLSRHPSIATHTHCERHSKRAKKEIELCMFYYLSGAVL